MSDFSAEEGVDAPSEAWQTVSDWSESDCITTAVLRAIAETTGRDPRELPPLYETVDPDSLNALFNSKPDGAIRLNGRLVFTHADCEIEVRANGRVHVTRQFDE